MTSVPEGIVMLTDSMLTYQQWTMRGLESTNFEHATKLFELGTTARAAAMISGTGSIGTRLVSQLIGEASIAIDARDLATLTHAEIVQDVIAAIATPYDALVDQIKTQHAQQLQGSGQLAAVNAQRVQRGLPPLMAITKENIGIANWPGGPPYADFYVQAPALEVILVSYHSTSAVSSLKWPGAVNEPMNGMPGSVVWSGSGGSAVSRLIKGYDLELMQQLTATNTEAAQAFAYLEREAAQYQMPAAFAIMPLQEAVYFTEFMGHVAAGYDHFRLGAPGVGGDMSVLILTDNSRKWVRRPTLKSGLGEHFSGWSGMSTT